jgi:hypothetical protein
LTEVLIAMGILTLGLLGVAAIFPVGGYYMQKAAIADNGSAIAQAVMNDIVSRGFLNPRTWRVMVPLGTAPPLLSDQGNSGTFTRRFGLALNEVGLQLSFQGAASNNRAALLVQQFGNVFVIDPMGVASMAFPRPLGPYQWNAVASGFPASANEVYGSFTYNQWQTWGLVWPVRRATFQDPRSQWPMDRVMAEHFFRGNDDLTTDLPDRDDRPALQNWDVDANGKPLGRQWTGDYSWLVTVVPTTFAALEGMARNPESFAYDVSVVVFYKRALPEGAEAVATVAQATPTGAADMFRDTMGDQERMVKAKIVSTGLNGGELLLEDFGDHYTNKSPFSELKVGQWVMLCGPHPNSSNVEPRFATAWYQVLSIDAERTAGLIDDPTKQRIIAVRGPQWPWQPAANLTDSVLSNYLCVAICRGAVAVHTKTLRLEGPSGSAWATYSPTTSEQQPPYRP